MKPVYDQLQLCRHFIEINGGYIDNHVGVGKSFFDFHYIVGHYAMP